MKQPILLAFAASIALTASSHAVADAQARPNAQRVPNYLATKLVYRTGWSIPGKWVYRSWVDRPDVLINGDANTALSLLFGEGTMTLSVPAAGKVAGTFDMGGGYVLDLTGTVKAAGTGQTAIHMAGLGRPSTPTAGWEYDYDGMTTERWPKSIGQVPAFTGSVFRAKPHDGNPAGFVASFIAVKKP